MKPTIKSAPAAQNASEKALPKPMQEKFKKSKPSTKAPNSEKQMKRKTTQMPLPTQMSLPTAFAKHPPSQETDQRVNKASNSSSTKHVQPLKRISIPLHRIDEAKCREDKRDRGG
jgi:hypothetical protein